jgi:hypothetical protein
MTKQPCPFCSGPTRLSVGCWECLNCGMDVEFVTAMRMERMSARSRAHMTGYLHAVQDKYYRYFMSDDMPRAEERAYAQGWLSVPANSARRQRHLDVWGKEARRAASWWR